MSDQDLKAVEAHGVAVDRREMAWQSVYQDSYRQLPEQRGGGLLKEAVDSLSQGDEIDDLIIAAYDNGNTETVGFLVSLLINRYRKREAERAADEATGE
jgi:hypothetical protein